MPSPDIDIVMPQPFVVGDSVLLRGVIDNTISKVKVRVGTVDEEETYDADVLPDPTQMGRGVFSVEAKVPTVGMMTMCSVQVDGGPWMLLWQSLPGQGNQPTPAIKAAAPFVVEHTEEQTPKIGAPNSSNEPVKPAVSAGPQVVQSGGTK